MAAQHTNGNRGCFISLAWSIGSVGIAWGSLMALASPYERLSVQRGIFLTSLGFVHFISLTDFFNKYLMETNSGKRFRQKYRLMVSDAMDITNKMVSSIQAAFSFIAGFMVCNSSCRRSFMTASHFMSEAYAWFGTAYFIYDIWSMYKVHVQKLSDKLKVVQKDPTACNASDGTKKIRKTNGAHDTHCSHEKKPDSKKTERDSNYKYDEEVMTKEHRISFYTYCITHPLIIFHHLFIGSVGFLVIVYLRGNFGDCVYGFIYMMEFSTPFVSFRSILSTLGMKDTRMYIVNGLTMLVTFFICRIVMWPYVFYWYSEICNKPVIQALLSLPRGCKMGIMVLLLPQVYWFFLMVKGALKVFLPQKTSEKKKSSPKEENATLLASDDENEAGRQNDELTPQHHPVALQSPRTTDFPNSSSIEHLRSRSLM